MLNKIKSEFENKKIAILGFGREGKSTLSFIVSYVDMATVVVLDEQEVDISEYVEEIQKLGKNIEISKITGDKYLDELSTFDVIMKSPGISLDEERTLGLQDKLNSQTNIFLKYFKDKVIGITGTKGKSTTSTLIYEILKKEFKVCLVGNIGIPCFDKLKYWENVDYFVFELSAHQLEYVKYSPHISVFLNIYEEHLDYYKTMKKYTRAKQNIFLFQNSDDIFIYNKEQTDLIYNENSTAKVKYEISTDIKEEELTYAGHAIHCLIGKHNIYNMLVAIKVATTLKEKEDNILNGLLEFKPLPHRLECFKEENKIKYIDDSISTIPEATISAVKAIKKVGTLLVGGMDRNIDYKPLVEYIKKLDEGVLEEKLLAVIFMYDSGKKIFEILSKEHIKNIKIKYCANLEDAVILANKLNVSEYACVLSPAAASYGFFKNFEERGDTFKNLINM